MAIETPPETGENLSQPGDRAGSAVVRIERSPSSFLYFGLGWLCVAIGFVGVFLPVLPTTPFLLIAVWAFARSSPRFHNWLLTHKTLGPYVRDWHENRAIPVKGKILSVVMMTASLSWLAFGTQAPTYAVALVAVMMAAVAAFILSRPSQSS